MDNNYDKIAHQYDFLSRLVFFKSQVKAQINQLQYLPEHASILIVGGGTGWILEEMAKVYASGLRITYVEISERMISLSMARNFRDNEVKFINLGIEDFKADQPFDVILTPFLFDNFAENRAGAVFESLHSCLKVNGLWLFVDFSLNPKNGRWWKSMVLKSMYFFFKMMGIVEADQLIDMSPYFMRHKYHIVEQRFYYGSFISATVYQNKMTVI